PDPYQGNADLTAKFSDELGAHELEVGLGAGGKHRPDGDVIGARGLGGPRLLEAVRGQTEDHSGAEQGSRRRRRQIVLAQVDPVRAERERQIEPVVDDERRAYRATAIAQPFGHRQEASRRPLLLAELNEATASGQRRVENRQQITPARRGTVEDHVKVPVLHGCRRRPSTLVKRPSTNAESLKTLSREGMDVLQTSTVISNRARAIRADASRRYASTTC